MSLALKNDRLIRALLRQPVDVTPVWIMRQAGRYLPEYRAIRKKEKDFMVLCKTPTLACELSLQPIERYPLDAAILFSDILTIPDAMGLRLSIVENIGPRFASTVRTMDEVRALSIPDPGQELSYVIDTVALIRKSLNGRVPLIGFAGSPWTLSTYMIEGGASKDFYHAKKMLYAEPLTVHALLEKLTAAIVLYLNAQIRAGAQVIMLFDTWGGILTGDAYREFSLQYMQEIIKQLLRTHDDTPVPVILFTKHAGLWVEQIAATGCDAIGLDWGQDIGQVRRQLDGKVALQGNMDPAVLHAAPVVIRNEVAKILERYGHSSGHIFNLGHGIQQYTHPEQVTVLIDAVHELSRQYHRS